MAMKKVKEQRNENSRKNTDGEGVPHESGLRANA